MKTIFLIESVFPGMAPDIDVHAGRYLKRFVLDASGSPAAQYAGLETTREKEEAMQFPSHKEAAEFWQQQSRLFPLRPDGKPNRPLTVYSALIE